MNDQRSNEFGTPINQSELNPDSFTDGVAPTVLEPTILTGQSGSGKSHDHDTLILTDDGIKEMYPKGFYIGPRRNMQDATPEVQELTLEEAKRAEQRQMLGRVGRTASQLPN